MTTINNITINIEVKVVSDNLEKPSPRYEYQIFMFDGTACVVNVPFNVEHACIMDWCIFINGENNPLWVNSGIKMDTHSAKSRKVNSRVFYPEIQACKETFNYQKALTAFQLNGFDEGRQTDRNFDYSKFDSIPEEYEWIATDEHGSVTVYTCKPRFESRFGRIMSAGGKYMCIGNIHCKNHYRWRSSVQKIVRKTKVFGIDISPNNRNHKYATANQNGEVFLWKQKPRFYYKHWEADALGDYGSYIGIIMMSNKNAANTLTKIDWKD